MYTHPNKHIPPPICLHYTYITIHSYILTYANRSKKPLSLSHTHTEYWGLYKIWKNFQTPSTAHSVHLWIQSTSVHCGSEPSSYFGLVSPNSRTAVHFSNTTVHYSILLRFTFILHSNNSITYSKYSTIIKKIVIILNFI